MSAGVDRRTHNEEMWNRPGLPPVRFLSASRNPCMASREAVEAQGVGE